MTARFAVDLDRTIAAPRPRVYRAWLDPVLLARWMGPDGLTPTLATVDERVGGTHVVEMLDDDGRRHAFTSVIEELVADERIVLTFRFEPDAEATLLTITMRDAAEGGTELHLRHERIPLDPPFDQGSVGTGWGQALDHLQQFFDQGGDP